MYHLRARSALASLGSGNDAAALQDALRCASAIERERLAWTVPWAKLAIAAVHARKAELGRALELLEQAESGFEAASMDLYKASARRARGRLIGGDAGAALVAEADAFMAKESIVNPG